MPYWRSIKTFYSDFVFFINSLKTFSEKLWNFVFAEQFWTFKCQDKNKLQKVSQELCLVFAYHFSFHSRRNFNFVCSQNNFELKLVTNYKIELKNVKCGSHFIKRELFFVYAEQFWTFKCQDKTKLQKVSQELRLVFTYHFSSHSSWNFNFVCSEKSFKLKLETHTFWIVSQELCLIFTHHFSSRSYRNLNLFEIFLKKLMKIRFSST